MKEEVASCQFRTPDIDKLIPKFIEMNQLNK